MLLDTIFAAAEATVRAMVLQGPHNDIRPLHNYSLVLGGDTQAPQ